MHRPQMTIRCLVVIAIAASGCAGSPSPSGPTPYLDVWQGFDAEWRQAGAQGMDCQDAFAAFNWDFGVRGLACVADRVAPLGALASRAPVDPFVSGPHKVADGGARLELNSAEGFGHYDPAFAEWFVDHAVPDESLAVRAVVQPVYDRYVSRLARIYWLTAADLERRGFPGNLEDGPFDQYQTYLETGAVPADMESWHSGFSVFAFTDASERLLSDVGLEVANEWTLKYEGNTAYGFWMRREMDGTREAWHDGLSTLLERYDAAWLASRS